MILNFRNSLIFSIILTTTVIGCSSSNGSSSGSVTPTGATLITIDSAGVVPIIGNSPTTSVVYVHNNSNVVISGITYVAQNNTGGGNSFLDNNSAQACSTIPAGQSCPLTFTTPTTINSANAQGSTSITASYSVKNYNNGQTNTFNQIISYAIVPNASIAGAVFNSGVLLTSSGNPTAYGTVYLYGSGTNQIYTVNSLVSSKSGVTIIQGNITGKQIQSNYIQAVEISAPASLASSTNVVTVKDGNQAKNTAVALTAGFNASLTATSSLPSGTQFTSVANVGVAPAASGAILTAGQVPIINSSVANPSGSMYITNSGNATATLGSITYPSGVSASTGAGACGSTLAAGAGCTVYFTVPQAGGNGNISIPYTGGSASPLVQTVTWYNSIGDALLSMSVAANPLSFSATVGRQTTVTVTNIGGYNLTGVSSSATTTSGSATGITTTPICIESGGASSGTTLYVGGRCTYTVTVNDSATEPGNINLGISGSYNNGSVQTYSRMLAMSYISNTYTALLSVSATSMTIVGNNTDSATQTMIVSNNGEAPAVISASSLTTAPGYMTITSDGCNGQTLTASGTCQVVVKLGPTTAQSQITGTAIYTATYSGGQAAAGTTANGSIPYTIQANNQNFTLGTPTVSGGITGNGTLGTPYTIPGTASNPEITFTYTNSGTNPAQVSGVNNTNSPIAWVIDTANSTCYNSGALPSATIAPSASCTIVFKNVLSQYAQAVSGGLGSSYTENLTVPTLTFQDQTATGTQFNVQPSAPAPINGTTVYVNGTQAVLTNAASKSGSNFTVSQTLTNAVGYSALTVTSSMENYFTGTPATSNCTNSTSPGVQSQTCTLTPDPTLGTATASVVYTLNTGIYPSGTLDVLFGLTSSSQVVSFSPLSANVTFP